MCRIWHKQFSKHIFWGFHKSDLLKVLGERKNCKGLPYIFSRTLSIMPVSVEYFVDCRVVYRVHLDQQKWQHRTQQPTDNAQRRPQMLLTKILHIKKKFCQYKVRNNNGVVKSSFHLRFKQLSFVFPLCVYADLCVLIAIWWCAGAHKVLCQQITCSYSAHKNNVE